MRKTAEVSADVERRRRNLESALGSLRIEGLETSAEARDSRNSAAALIASGVGRSLRLRRQF